MLRSHIVDNFAEKLACFDRILAYDPNNGLVAAGRDSLAAIVAAAEPNYATSAAAESEVTLQAQDVPMIDPNSVTQLDEPELAQDAPEILRLESFGVGAALSSNSEMIVLPTTETQEMRIEFDSEGQAVLEPTPRAAVHREVDAPGDADPIGVHDIETDPAPATTKRILVVDDSPTIRKLISGKLEKSGHEVICAEDGVEAIANVERAVPDLVLLDITMPRMDGYEVCKVIRGREATKDVPVIMISGKDGFFDKVRGRMAGASGYITKPFGPETLMKTVEACLNGEMPEFA
jgi:twitching motility two-component system response regulator PilG